MLGTTEEMSTEATAAHLAIRPEKVTTRLHRAHRLLRCALDRRMALTFTELFPLDGARCGRVAVGVLGPLRKRS